MLHNDISNNLAPILAFDMDSLLFVPETENTKWYHKILRTKPSIDKKGFNELLLNVLRSIWMRYDLSVFLVTFKYQDEEVLDALYGRLSEEGVPITNIVFHQEWDDVLYRLNNGRYKYFISSDEDLINYLGRNCYHITDIGRIL